MIYVLSLTQQYIYKINGYQLGHNGHQEATSQKKK